MTIKCSRVKNAWGRRGCDAPLTIGPLPCVIKTLGRRLALCVKLTFAVRPSFVRQYAANKRFQTNNRADGFCLLTVLGVSKTFQINNICAKNDLCSADIFPFLLPWQNGSTRPEMDFPYNFAKNNGEQDRNIQVI